MITVRELLKQLGELPPDMEVGVEASEDNGDNLSGHQITGRGYVMDFTEAGTDKGSKVFLLRIDRDEDSTGRWNDARAVG